MPHLSLSDAQLKHVLAAAECIPHRWRSRFLESIFDRLLSNIPPTDHDVSEAIHNVAERLHVNIAQDLNCISCEGVSE